MKKALGWIVIFILLWYLYGLLNPPPQNSKPEVKSWSSNYEPFLAKVRSEPKVKEALITDAGVLYASVVDDGTPRDGYASYLCELVREFRVDVKRVKVVEFGTTNHPEKDNAYGVLLGSSWCD